MLLLKNELATSIYSLHLLQRKKNDESKNSKYTLKNYLQTGIWHGATNTMDELTE